MDIKTVLQTGLRKVSEQHTIQALGDRSEYLGASDIGHCPRKVILERIHPADEDLVSLIRYERGHMAEDIIAKAFDAAGYSNFERQVEIVLPGNAPIKAHIDFVFTSCSHKVKSILEVKSTSRIPDGPYSSWETQLYIQMGALAEQYPEYSIRGAILALDIADAEVGFFNGYEPEERIYNGLQERAGRIWSQYQAVLQDERSESELPTEVGPLCGYCGHSATCPRFQAEELPDLEKMVVNLRDLQAREKRLTGEIKELKRHLLAAVEAKGGPIRSGGCFLRKATRNRKHLDTNRLKAFLAESGLVLDEFHEDRPFSFLEIKKVA
ncbi:hypothetical protein ACLG6S_16395 [Thermodesulfobacteriota bacterium B35]